MDFIPVFNLSLETVYLKDSTPHYSNSIKNFENLFMTGASDVFIIGDKNENILKGGTGDERLLGAAVMIISRVVKVLIR